MTPNRAFSRWCAAFVLCCVSFVCLLGSMLAPTASAEGETDTPTPLTVGLSFPQGEIVAPDETLNIRVTLTNSSESPVSLESATLSASYGVLSNATLLYNWFDGEMPSVAMSQMLIQPSSPESPESPSRASSGTSSTPAGTSSTQSDDPLSALPASLDAGMSASVDMQVNPQQRGWITDAYYWGARGLEIAVTGIQHGEYVTAEHRSVAVSIPSTKLTPFPIASVVVCEANVANLAAEPSVFNMLLTPQTQDTKPSDAPNKKNTPRSNLWDAWDIAGINLFVDPQNFVNPTGEDNGKTVFPAELTNASIYELPPFDADISALAHANADALLDSMLAATTPSSADTASAQASTSSNQETASPQATAHRYLPLTTDPDSLTVKFADAHNLGTPIVPSSALTGVDSFYFPDARGLLHVDGTEHASIVANSDLTSVLNGSLLSPTGDEPLALNKHDAQAAALAYSAILYTQAPSYQRSLVTMNRVDCTQSTQVQALQALMATPWLAPTSLDDLTNPDSANSPASTDASSDATSMNNGGTPLWTFTHSKNPHSQAITPEDIATVESFVNDSAKLSQVLDKNSPFPSTAASYAYSAVNQAWRSHPNLRNTRLASLDLPGFLRSHVTIQSTSRITIIAESSNLPLRVKSTLGVPLRLTPALDIPDARLQQGESSPVTIKPDSTTTIEVPVTVNGSGSLSIQATLIGKTGINLANPVQINIRLHASWETIGVFSIAGVMFIVLLVGVVRSVRAGRRSAPIPDEQFTQGLRHATVRPHTQKFSST